MWSSILSIPKTSAFSILINAMLIVTAKSTTHYAWYGNERARKRAFELNRALLETGSEFGIIGQYHIMFIIQMRKKESILIIEIKFFSESR